MSIFSKTPKDGRGGDGQQKPEPQAAKVPAAAPANKQVAQQRGPAPQVNIAAPAPAAAAPSLATRGAPASIPAVVVTRSIDLGGPPRTQARPSMPNVNIGPPSVQPSPSQAPPPVPVPATVPMAAPAPAAAAPAPPPPAAPSSSPTLEIERPVARTLRMEVQPAPQSPQSVRPTAPDIKPPEAIPSIADTFERLLSADDVEAGFAGIERKSNDPAPATGPMTVGDLAEVRVLFAELAANHVRQVRDFLIDLRWSEATVDWVGICEPALRSLRRAADKLELAELCAALDAFAQTLSAAASTGGRTIEGPARDGILARYEALTNLMPQAFALDLDRSQREAAILQSLLLQVRDVKKVTLDKLYAAGLTTLEAMRLATPEDIAATTGIGAELATRIVTHFRAYHESARGAAHDATRTQERERVTELTRRLRKEHQEFEVASQGWTREAGEQKKALRKARGQTLLDIQVILARLGEVERLQELEKLSFERKLVFLESFLEEAREKYVAQS